jgi:translation elongation factor P/translation initiation factor 5A
MAINYNGDVCVVQDSQHRTPGNLRAFVQATLRSIRSGRSADDPQDGVQLQGRRGLRLF